MADYVHASRRYVFVETDPEWLALSVSARALAKLLVVYADDEGVLVYQDADETAAAALIRRIQAAPREHAWIEAAVLELVTDTYLVVDPPDPPRVRQMSPVRIRNFRTAQGITETAAERKARQRKEAEKKARQRAAKRGGPANPSDVPPRQAEDPGAVPPSVPPPSPSRVGAPAHAPASPFRSVPVSDPSDPRHPPVPPKDSAIPVLPRGTRTGPAKTRSKSAPAPRVPSDHPLAEAIASSPYFAGEDIDPCELAATWVEFAARKKRSDDELVEAAERAFDAVAIALHKSPGVVSVTAYASTTLCNLLEPGALEAARAAARPLSNGRGSSNGNGIDQDAAVALARTAR